MASILEERVKGFLETWRLQKAGELPEVDLVVRCLCCGSPKEVEFSTLGFLCRDCLKREELEE